LDNPSDLAAAPSVEDGVFVCDTSVDELWRNERARARKVHVAEKTSLVWAQNRDDRACWARTALLEVDAGGQRSFICFDDGLGDYRNVRVALYFPGDKTGSRKEALMHDERFREQINKLCRAGAVVVQSNRGDPFDLLLVPQAFDLRDRIGCFGLAELQERGLILLWEPFVDQALASSTAVLGEDEASVALRKEHAIFWRTPKTGRFRPDMGQKPPDVVDGIPRVALGTNHSFEVDPEVLEASDRRVAERLDASRGPRRRRRGR